MEPLESEGVYICCGCGKRVPASISTPMPVSTPTFQSQVSKQSPPITSTSTTKQGEGGIKVVNTQGGSGSGSGREKKNIVFAQPKHQSAKDWFKRKHDPKNNGKYDADDIALMNRSGVTITHTFEIKRRPDTLPNSTDYRNENRKQKRLS
jgi:hypothetical protein